MTLGDLQMTLRPPTTVSLARTFKMLQKLSNIRVRSSYSTHVIKEKPYFSLFLQIYLYDASVELLFMTSNFRRGIIAEKVGVVL